MFARIIQLISTNSTIKTWQGEAGSFEGTLPRFFVLKSSSLMVLDTKEKRRVFGSNHWHDAQRHPQAELNWKSSWQPENYGCSDPAAPE